MFVHFSAPSHKEKKANDHGYAPRTSALETDMILISPVEHVPFFRETVNPPTIVKAASTPARVVRHGSLICPGWFRENLYFSLFASYAILSIPNIAKTIIPATIKLIIISFTPLAF